MNINVIRNEPDQLELRLTPKSSFLMVVFGLLFIMSGMATIWVLGSVSRVSIDSDELRFEQRLLDQMSVKQRTVPVEQILEINTKIYSFWISQSYEVNVVTRLGEFPIPFAGLDGDQKKERAVRMQAALESREATDYASGTGTMWIGLLLGVACVIAGCVCLAFLQTSTISAERDRDRFEVQIKRWLIPNSQSVETTSIKEITGIEDVEYEVGRGTHVPTASSNFVFLKTKQNRSIYLSNGPMFTDKSAREIQDILVAWIQKN